VITHSNGDMFAIGADALVNPVNCVGTMGAGLALVFKRRFPAAFKAYSHACADGLVRSGSIYTFVEDGITLFHFPTKRHWRDRSKLVDIQKGLLALRTEIVSTGVKSVAVPALGCGLGGLDWDEVKPCIDSALSNMRTQITVFAPR